MLVNGSHDVDEESHKLQVGHVSLARGKQLRAGVGAKAPVVVLARAVDALERLFVQQHAEVVAAGNVVHKQHQQQVVVVGKVGFLVYRSQFKLVGCNFVVAGLCRNAQFVALYFKVEHESLHARRNRTEVVVFELLVLGTVVAHQCAPGEHQVGTRRVKQLINKEVFLFPTKV